MSGTHGQHGRNAARHVEVAKGKRPGLSESRSNMEALSAVATIQKKNHATIILAVSFSIHVHILEACPNPDLVSGLLRIFSIFLRTVHRICQNATNTLRNIEKFCKNRDMFARQHSLRPLEGKKLNLTNF